MTRTVLIILLLTPCIESTARAAQEPPPVSAYDPDPHHPWNRLFGAFYVHDIEYANTTSPFRPNSLGPDVLDPPLGIHPRFLLDQEPFDRCNAALDEFLTTHAEQLFHDPLRRAILQRDL